MSKYDTKDRSGDDFERPEARSPVQHRILEMDRAGILSTCFGWLVGTYVLRWSCSVLEGFFLLPLAAKVNEWKRYVRGERVHSVQVR